MTDLLHTVQARYVTRMGFAGLFTLTQRRPPRKPRLDRILGDARRETLRTVARDMRQLAKQLEHGQIRAEKRLRDEARRAQRQIGLQFAKDDHRIRQLAQQTRYLLKRDAERDMLAPPTAEASLTYRRAGQLMEERVEKAGEALLAAANVSSRRALREILRRERDERQYQQRRNGVN